MKSINLESLYRSVNENTFSIWSENAGVGAVKEGNYYDPVRLALAAGIQPPVTFDVSRLICELQQLTKDDPLPIFCPHRVSILPSCP